MGNVLSPHGPVWLLDRFSWTSISYYLGFPFSFSLHYGVTILPMEAIDFFCVTMHPLLKLFCEVGIGVNFSTFDI